MLSAPLAHASGPYSAPNCASSSSIGGQTARAMTEAANGAFNRDARVYEQTAQSSAEAIERGIGCVNEVTQAINAIIPTFGGGLVAQFASQMVSKLANQACQLVSRTQNQLTNQANQLVNGALGNVNQSTGQYGVTINPVNVGNVIAGGAPANGSPVSVNPQQTQSGVFHSVTTMLSSVF